jgi:hypothetical protein
MEALFLFYAMIEIHNLRNMFLLIVILVGQFIDFSKHQILKNVMDIETNVYLHLALEILKLDDFPIFKSMIQVDL